MMQLKNSLRLTALTHCNNKRIVVVQSISKPTIYAQFSSIKNYMKTYEPQNISRHHGQFRVDEQNSFVQNQKKLQDFIEIQKRRYESESSKWKSYTEKYYKKTSQRRDIRHTSIGEEFDNFEYFTRVKYHEDKDYTTIHRKPLHKTTSKNLQTEELVLDIMQYPFLRANYKTIQLKRTNFSGTEHRYMAFGFDLYNDEVNRFMIKDLKENRIVGMKGWANNLIEADSMVFNGEKGVFFVKTHNRRPSKVFYQGLGDNANSDQPVLLYEETDQEFWLDIAISKDKKYLILSSNSKSHTKTMSILLNEQSDALNKLIPLQIPSKIPTHPKAQKQVSEPQKVIVNHCENFFIICREFTKTGQYQILRKSDCKQGKNNEAIQVLHELSSSESLTDVDIFKNHIVLYIQKNTKPILRVINIQTKQILEPKSPHPIGRISPGSNENYESSKCIVYFSTPFIYNQGYSYHIDSGKWDLVEKFQLTGPKFNEKAYQVEEVEVPSKTGDLIPLTIISKKYLLRQQRSPQKLVVRLYGAYGLPNEVSYDNGNAALLENNWVIAYAHIRGGNEKGRQWHLAAKSKRSLSWEDLEDCVAYLIKHSYTHPSLLFLSSHSAGSIAIWNAINKNPHLYKGVILSYPFLDVLNSLLSPQDPLSFSDHEEFGNPSNSLEHFRRVESFSPYDNIQSNIEYPYILIVGGEKDYRCELKTLIKFYRRFLERNKIGNSRLKNQIVETDRKMTVSQDPQNILLKIQEDSSHLGASSIRDQNYNQCELYGLMDYLVHERSKDCEI